MRQDFSKSPLKEELTHLRNDEYKSYLQLAFHFKKDVTTMRYWCRKLGLLKRTNKRHELTLEERKYLIGKSSFRSSPKNLIEINDTKKMEEKSYKDYLAEAMKRKTENNYMRNFHASDYKKLLDQLKK